LQNEGRQDDTVILSCIKLMLMLQNFALAHTYCNSCLPLHDILFLSPQLNASLLERLPSSRS